MPKYKLQKLKLQKIRNDDIQQAFGRKLDKVVQRRLQWFGHVERTTFERIPHNALHASRAFFNM